MKSAAKSSTAPRMYDHALAHRGVPLANPRPQLNPDMVKRTMDDQKADAQMKADDKNKIDKAKQYEGQQYQDQQYQDQQYQDEQYQDKH